MHEYVTSACDSLTLTVVKPSRFRLLAVLEEHLPKSYRLTVTRTEPESLNRNKYRLIVPFLTLTSTYRLIVHSTVPEACRIEL